MTRDPVERSVPMNNSKISDRLTGEEGICDNQSSCLAMMIGTKLVLNNADIDLRNVNSRSWTLINLQSHNMESRSKSQDIPAWDGGDK